MQNYHFCFPPGGWPLAVGCHITTLAVAGPSVSQCAGVHPLPQRHTTEAAARLSAGGVLGKGEGGGGRGGGSGRRVMLLLL